jgi:enoyl-CoA hydratase/carnithine racemase
VSTDRVTLDIDEAGVAIVTLAHPPLNIYDLAMRDDLIAAITAIRDIPSVRALLLRAEGKHFSAGADLSEFGSADSIHEARRIRWDCDPWIPLLNLPVPSVAALHGFTVGSGMEMAMLCDIRIASPDLQIGLPETKLSMLPAAGGTQSLTRAIGPHAALPLVLTARNLDADEALRRGIIWSIADDVDLAACAIAEQLAELDPQVARSIRRCLHASGDLPIEAGLALESRLGRPPHHARPD